MPSFERLPLRVDSAVHMSEATSGFARTNPHVASKRSVRQRSKIVSSRLPAAIENIEHRAMRE